MRKRTIRPWGHGRRDARYFAVEKYAGQANLPIIAHLCQQTPFLGSRLRDLVMKVATHPALPASYPSPSGF